MNTATEERKIEEQGPTFAFMWTEDPRDSGITISYTGRFMPWRRASGLSSDEQEKARKGNRVLIGGCPRCSGTTWREVVYHRGRYRTRIPSAEVLYWVEIAVYDWREMKERDRKVEEGMKTLDEITRIRLLMAYGPKLLAQEFANTLEDIDCCVELAYRWDTGLIGDD